MASAAAGTSGASSGAAVGIRERLPELTVESFTETDRTGGRASDKRSKMELE